MDDNDVCPLCCEELDISDRQFFPCKCGYQVCMWCWHRIRETESGLCPACRTPYGDDPHEFSAVDMEEVVKANKEKAAAEKRERDRIRQQQAATSGSGSASGSAGNAFVSASGVGAGVGGMHVRSGSDGEHALSVGNTGVGRGNLDPPKDRNQLANMRVIRRNLVYAVGLPPSIATEDTLRKPEYFGQYGKISKIVLNRNHNGNGDPRRASASAYVTFVHKEDTLACILALDGFYLEGRNVRASYGTSKYCSAFIKNVRCNNPDCTYLHYMGEPEDSFTKQEIQAGYVTSGRDVLARQQQQMAAAQGSSSVGGTMSGNSGSRRRVGGGGPSGTGKACANPVFPPPCFDEPHKASSSSGLVGSSSSSVGSLTGVSHASLNRSVSVGPGFSTVAVSGASAPSSSSLGTNKILRSSSLSTPGPGMTSQATNVLGGAPSASSVVSGIASVPPSLATTGQAIQAVPAGASTEKQARRVSSQNSKGVIGSSSGTTAKSSSTIPTASTTTAASVVAGVHHPSGSFSSSAVVQPPPHTTLTPLTPLKRGSSLPISSKGNSAPAAPGKPSAGASVSNNSNSISLTAAPSTSGTDGVDFIQLPPNMPVPKGLTPAEKAALIEQRREAMAAMARQQREMTMKLTALRSGGNTSCAGVNVVQSNGASVPGAVGTASSSPTSSVSSSSGTSGKNASTCGNGNENGVGAIGGTVIEASSSGASTHGAHLGVVGAGPVGSLIGRASNGPSLPSGLGGLGGFNSICNDSCASPDAVKGGPTPSPWELGSIGGKPIGEKGFVGTSCKSSSNSVGGNFVGSQSSSANSSSLLAPSAVDKWGASSTVPTRNSGAAGLFGSSGVFGISGDGIWGNNPAGGAPLSAPLGNSGASRTGLLSSGVVERRLATGVAGGSSGVIGEGTSRSPSCGGVGGGNLLGKNPFASQSDVSNSGSSVLASILGINLPTGSGSLKEASHLWESSTSTQPSVGGLSGAVGPSAGAVSSEVKSGDAPVGGLTIGGNTGGGSGVIPIGGFRGNGNVNTSVGGSNSSDIALLQSLLPGVHITSGNAYQPAAPMSSSSGSGVVGGGGWGPISGFAPAPPQSQRGHIHFGISDGGLNLHQRQQGGGDTWGGSGLYSAAPGAPVGVGSRDATQRNEQKGSIW